MLSQNKITMIFNNKYIEWIKKYYFLLLIIFSFSVIIYPLCFINNDYIELVTAEHIDSGSILSSILQLFNRQPITNFYNQNVPFHTVYGFPYNSFLFFVFGFYKTILDIDVGNNFYIFAMTARLLNLAIALLIIRESYLLSQKILKNKIFQFIFLFLVSFFPAFIDYSYQIKPDLLGLFLSLVSFNYLYDFINYPKDYKNIIKANIFAGLSILCKQPHIFSLFPLAIGFFFSIKLKNKENYKIILSVYLRSFIVFIAIFFLVHPYAFIQPERFINKQLSLSSSMTSTTVVQNILSWIDIYKSKSYRLLIVVAPIFYTMYMLLKRKRNKNQIYLYLLESYIVTYILWLTFKIGPIRTEAYLLPVYIFSIIILIYLIEQLTFLISITANKVVKYVSTLLLLVTLVFIFVSTTSSIVSSCQLINNSKAFKKTPQIQSVNQLLSVGEIESKTIIHSASLPVNSTVFEDSKNSWQFNDIAGINDFHPDLILVDLTTSWEKPYNYWKDIASQNNLNKEIFYTKNTDKNNNIILFYKN